MGKVCAIIAAAGKGKRMDIGFNKQFISIKDRPVLFYTLDVFNNDEFIDEIVICANESEIDFIQSEIVEKYNLFKVSAVVAGGKERQESVFNALKSISACEIVIIHDGARPFVNTSIIDNGIKYARQYGAAACGVVPKDTIKTRGNNGFSSGTLSRNELFCVQTPQCFNYEKLLECYEKAEGVINKYTDDTSIFEDFGYQVYLYEGSYNNIKITTPEDLIIADTIIEERNMEN